MLQIIIGIFLISHGLIHLIGFVVPWKIVRTGEMPYTTTVLVHKVDLGDAGIRVIGILWLLAAAGYVAAGIGLISLAPWWLGLTGWVTLFSLGLCLLGWPEAQFGAYIDLAIIAFLFLGGRFGWLP